MVPELRLPRAGRHGVPSRSARSRAGNADGAAAAERAVSPRRRSKREFDDSGRIGHSSAIQASSRLQRDHVGEDGDGLQARHRHPAARGLQHARQPVRLQRASRRRRHAVRAARGSPLRRLQSLERRLPPQPDGDGRPAAGRDEASAPASRARAGLQLHARARRIARTSSFRLARPIVSPGGTVPGAVPRCRRCSGCCRCSPPEGGAPRRERHSAKGPPRSRRPLSRW